MTGLAGLRRFVTPPPDSPHMPAAGPTAVPAGARQGSGPAPQTSPAAPGAAEETCELCAAAVPAQHGHVADLETSSLMCACRACYLLFTHPPAGRAHYRAVPDRYLSDPAKPLGTAEWDALQVPVGLAFFLRSSRAAAVTGFYPSPAGATECKLDLQDWQRIEASHPLLGELADDVEAILVWRSGEGVEYFLVPIDICYELAGRMRMSWRGFDGGTEARQAVAEFLDTVRSRARPVTGRRP
ncbi:MAG TPA: DUF5947 family protein [Streptosporangiaceae bacterium]|nr:DUF5947 family protein [Streptosporangiaceae bacterium]